MSFPILFESTETQFDHNGYGFLSDCEACTVTEERNGKFELVMRYPLKGLHYEDISLRRILLAHPNPTSRPQPFRIYSVSRPMSGYVTVKAEHISYDLSGVVVTPFTATDVQSALLGFQDNAVTAHQFNFYSDKSTVAEFKVERPSSVRANLGGVAGSILDTYGGELEYDRFTVRLNASRGVDRGVSIRYGKNLTSLTQDEKISNVYTGVIPFWTDAESGDSVMLDERIVPVDGDFEFVRLIARDMSSEFDHRPTQDELRQKTQSYIKNNDVGKPSVSLAVRFEQLLSSSEYNNVAILDTIALCDTVTVEFPAIGVSSKTKVTETVYNVLLEKFDQIKLGSVTNTLADTVSAQNTSIAEKPSISDVKNTVKAATAEIAGAHGGSVRLLDTNDDGMPDTLYIADNPDPSVAQRVWRFNYNGWAASETGYAGEFKMAATLDGGIVADFVTAGNLNADLIRTGTLRSKDGSVTISINNSTLGMSVGSNLNIGNLSFFARTNGNVSIRWVGD